MPACPTRVAARSAYLGVAVTLTCLLAGCSTDSTGAEDELVFVTVSAGRLHTCGVTTRGLAYCWGSNQYGQLGNGATDDSPAPVLVLAGRQFTAVSAGFAHTCGIARNGVMYCWGGNFAGELGDGTETNRAVPAPVSSSSGSLTFRSVSTGEASSCGITPNGIGYCWGAPSGPAPGGTGSLPNATRPQPLMLGPLADLSAGYEIKCAVTMTGTVYCWGLSAPGVVDDQNPRDTAFPARVADAPVLLTVSAGHKHACGIAHDGQTFCWGRNTSGQLGDGTVANHHTPLPVSGDVVFDGVTAHAPSHTCALTDTGAAYCWGSNQYGQLGDGTTGGSTVPEPVSGDVGFSTVSTGFAHTCGVTAAGAAYCWGNGQVGQLGTGLLENSPQPARVVAQMP